MSEPILQCSNLKKSFNEGSMKLEVLRGVNFEVSKAEMIAIVGQSGSGKSTLMHLLGGLDRPTSGVVRVVGNNLAEMSEAAKGRLRNHTLGFVYQFHHLLQEFNTLENITLPLLIRGESKQEARDKAHTMLQQVGLEDRVMHRIGELSGGERQRVAIARALVTEPRCVLADEPTGNLDEATSQAVYELILKLNQQLSTSFILVTHSQELAARMDRCLLLHDGLLQG